MKEIKLNQKVKYKDKFVALVDDEDYEYLNQFNWHAFKNCNTYYVIRNVSLKLVSTHTSISMHRTIMNTTKGMEVDHIDHNGLNNQKSNLRNCTMQQNQTNRRSYGESKYLGVSFIHGKYKNKKLKYIQAAIQSNKKLIYLGCFKTEEEAARAYDTKAKELHGEFANLNFK